MMVSLMMKKKVDGDFDDEEKSHVFLVDSSLFCKLT